MKFTSIGLSDELLEASKTLLKQGKDYEDFFQSALKKFGVTSPAEFKSDEEKKKFFDYVDKNYKGKSEELTTEEVQLDEIQQKEVDALKKLSKDMQSVLKGYQKIARMGDKELTNTKYNKDYEAVLKSRDVILQLIGKVNTQKILNKEEVLEENIQKVLKMYPRDNDWKKLVTKYKRDIEAMRNNSKDLPSKTEDALLTWGFDNGEITNEDDAENFIDKILNA
jgi:hypothetical protein